MPMWKRWRRKLVAAETFSGSDAAGVPPLDAVSFPLAAPWPLDSPGELD